MTTYQTSNDDFATFDRRRRSGGTLAEAGGSSRSSSLVHTSDRRHGDLFVVFGLDGASSADVLLARGEDLIQRLVEFAVHAEVWR